MRLRLAAALTFVVLGASAWGAEAPAPGIGFKDCPDCPEMVVIAPGSFARGSPAREPGRSPNEGPRQIVTIPHRFALGKYELTKAQYAAFVAATGHRSNDPCMYLTEGDWANGADKDWRDPGFRQGSDEPVVCASWNDATAYARWLNAKTGRAYRLPTGAEWEYATRAGGQTARPWGGAPDGACRSANVYDQTALADLGITSPVHSCRDGYV
jgi:formylglycine-generating enzyme required for sulfatase activity